MTVADLYRVESTIRWLGVGRMGLAAIKVINTRRFRKKNLMVLEKIKLIKLLCFAKQTAQTAFFILVK